MDEKSGKKNSVVRVPTALNLVWSFGMNRNIPVINLSDDKRKGLFYVTAHTGVFLDFENNVQILYQGHCNAISSTCVSTNKRWLATADIGNNSMLLVWDTFKNIPIKTLFDVDPVGIQAICMSFDAKYIASLGCSFPQVICIWDWTTEKDVPIMTTQLSATYGIQNYITFSKENTFEIVSNSEKHIIFYKWDRKSGISMDAPELNDNDFNKTVGNYSQTVFQPGDIALTATTRGNIVAWVKISPTKWKASKVVRFQDSAITVLQIVNNFIVTGDVSGYVKFFDSALKLVNGYKQLGVQGAINAISFTYEGKDTKTQLISGELYPTCSTLEGTKFVVNDFSVSTERAQFIYFGTEGSRIRYMKRENERDIEAIACHPRGPFIAVGGRSGMLQVIDYETKKLINSKMYTDKNIEITSVAFCAEGENLAVGFDNGHFQVLDAVTLQEEGTGESIAKFDYSNDAISQIKFSHDSKYLAYCDNDMCVVVFTSNEDKNKPWCYLGKHRAHYKEIKDLMFLKNLDEVGVRLLSLGVDRMLVEYDIHDSSVDNLKVKSTERVEQDAVPICMTSYPPISKENFLLVCNDQFKMKLFNCTTKMCRYTFLGPTYGSPLQRIMNLPEVEGSQNRYMVYCTEDSEVGLAILPLDGNPHKCMALISHPGKVYNLKCSNDGKYVFTAGGTDNTVLMWKVDINALEANATLGGEDLIPFYAMIDGGKEGEFFLEMEDYFYYAQMRHQGVDTMVKRIVKNTIPLSELPFVMRALGFYPSEKQIEDMSNEIKFSEYVTTGQYVDELDLRTFIKLYVNHRPVFGMHISQLVDAFSKIGEDNNGEIQISRFHLLTLLQEKGEHMTEFELAEYLTLLLGDDNSDINEGKSLEDHLPENISLSLFASELLGLDPAGSNSL